MSIFLSEISDDQIRNSIIQMVQFNELTYLSSLAMNIAMHLKLKFPYDSLIDDPFLRKKNVQLNCDFLKEFDLNRVQPILNSMIKNKEIFELDSKWFSLIPRDNY